jgi:hypothetical protein
MNREAPEPANRAVSQLINLRPSRRALMLFGAAASAPLPITALAQVAGQACIPVAELQSGQPPWSITLDAASHPRGRSGLPTVRPGQPLRGVWAVSNWTCQHVGDTTSFQPIYRWEATPDTSRNGWTLEIDFERHAVVTPVTPGAFLGAPDGPTQGDFYGLAGAASATRTLTVVARDATGAVVATPSGPRNFTQNGGGPVASGLSVEIVLDRSNDLQFDAATPPDGALIQWKNDTLTVVVAGRTHPAAPGAPFSAMTANGHITMTDLTPGPAALPPQPSGYSIGFAAGGASNAVASASQTFNWPWFDHTPFGAITAPLSRNIRVAVDGAVTDAFGNTYPATPLSRSFVVAVSTVKVGYFNASHDSYREAGVAGVLGVIAAGIAAATAELPPASALFAATATAMAALSAYMTGVAGSQQANAADPPAPDPQFGALVPFAEETGDTIPAVKELANIRALAIACGTVSRIYPAITATEGRILGARRAQNIAAAQSQRAHLADLLKRLAGAAQQMTGLVGPAGADFARIMNNPYKPIDPHQLSDELARWAKAGVPPAIARAWTAAGMTSGAVAILQQRLADPALRTSAADFADAIKSLAANLSTAAAGADREARPFL